MQSAVLLSHVVCPSICLSVCNVGGSWPHRLKILETNCANNLPNIFTLRSPKVIHLLPGEHGEILGRLEVGWEKVTCWRTKVTISLKRVKIEEKLLWRAYRKSPMLFQFFASPPYVYFRFHLYGHWDGRFCCIFARTAQQSMLDGPNGLSRFNPFAYCQIMHRADIFAIAQLSCLIIWPCSHIILDISVTKIVSTNFTQLACSKL